jgi:4-amino-4-deoxy-L-arabinose transferase-like glycosyltransferase
MEEVTANSNERTFRHWLAVIMSAHILCWTLLPALILRNTYIDILENLVWGRHWQWGYDKNPYLGAWVTSFVYWLSGESVSAIYLTSQIAIVVCWLAVWRLALRMLAPAYAFIAVSALVGCRFFYFGSPQLNDNVLELPFWALTCLYFYDAVKTQRLKPWLLVGLFAGLASMSKYYTLMLLLTMLAFLIIQKQGRDSFRNRNFYLGLLVFLAITIPNFIWLIRHDFISIHYAFARADVGDGNAITLISHMRKPLSFLMSALGVGIPVIAIIALCFRKSLWPGKNGKNITLASFDWHYIVTLFFGPFLFTLFFSAITGAKIVYMWQTPLFNLLGILAVVLVQPVLSNRRFFCYGLCFGLLFLLWGGVYVWEATVRPYYRQKVYYEIFPGQAMAVSLNRQWRECYHVPLKYVAGLRKLSANIAIYAPDKPTAYFDLEIRCNQWLDESDFYRQGGLLVWEIPGGDAGLPPDIAKRFPQAELQPVQEFSCAINPWATRWLKGKTIPTVKIGVAFMPPQ